MSVAELRNAASEAHAQLLARQRDVDHLVADELDGEEGANVVVGREEVAHRNDAGRVDGRVEDPVAQELHRDERRGRRDAEPVREQRLARVEQQQRVAHRRAQRERELSRKRSCEPGVTMKRCAKAEPGVDERRRRVDVTFSRRRRAPSAKKTRNLQHGGRSRA